MRTPNGEARRLRALMMDLCCITPYYVGPLCRELEAAAIDVRLASISYRLDPGYFSRAGVPLHPSVLSIADRIPVPGPLRRAAKAAECGLNLRRLRRSLQSWRPDVAHVHQLVLLNHGIRWELDFLQCLRDDRIPLLYTVHNLLPHDTGDRMREAYRNVYSIPDLLILHSETARQTFCGTFGIDPRRTRVIPHGPLFEDTAPPPAAEARRQWDLAPGELMVLTQGFVKPYKGVDLLLEAWPAVVARVPRARLVIAGSGDPRLLQELAEQAARLGVAGSVRFISEFLSQTRVASLYQAADALVYPYRAITTSGALMTGIVFGKPIVASDLPAFRELLEDGRSARLAPAGVPGALAAAITEVLLDPALRDRLADASLELVRGRVSWRSIARQTAAAYRDAMLPEGGFHA